MVIPSGTYMGANYMYVHITCMTKSTHEITSGRVTYYMCSSEVHRLNAKYVDVQIKIISLYRRIFHFMVGRFIRVVHDVLMLFSKPYTASQCLTINSFKRKITGLISKRLVTNVFSS